MEAELTVAFLAFTERYTSRVTCVPYESVKVRLPLTLFGKEFFCSPRRESVIDCFFLMGLGGVCVDRLSRNRPRLCSRPSRRRGAFILRLPRRHRCTNVTVVLLLPRHYDRSRAMRRAAPQLLRMMSARRSYRLTSPSPSRIRFTPPCLVPFLGGYPG